MTKNPTFHKKFIKTGTTWAVPADVVRGAFRMSATSRRPNIEGVFISTQNREVWGTDGGAGVIFNLDEKAFIGGQCFRQETPQGFCILMNPMLIPKHKGFLARGKRLWIVGDTDTNTVFFLLNFDRAHESCAEYECVGCASVSYGCKNYPDLGKLIVEQNGKRRTMTFNPALLIKLEKAIADVTGAKTNVMRLTQENENTMIEVILGEGVQGRAVIMPMQM